MDGINERNKYAHGRKDQIVNDIFLYTSRRHFNLDSNKFQI